MSISFTIPALLTYTFIGLLWLAALITLGLFLRKRFYFAKTTFVICLSAILISEMLFVAIIVVQKQASHKEISSMLQNLKNAKSLIIEDQFLNQASGKSEAIKTVVTNKHQIAELHLIFKELQYKRQSPLAVNFKPGIWTRISLDSQTPCSLTMSGSGLCFNRSGHSYQCSSGSFTLNDLVRSVAFTSRPDVRDKLVRNALSTLPPGAYGKIQ